MTDEATVRRYRRLLHAYPGWHRHRYGPDLLTTLLDAAEADPGADSRRARAAIVADGLRTRVRVRGAGWLLAALAALAGAGALAGLAGFAGWYATVGPAPTRARAVALAGPLLPAGKPSVDTVSDGAYESGGDPLDTALMAVLGDPDPARGGVVLEWFEVPHRAAPLADAGRYLSGHGWRVRHDAETLVADRAGLRIELTVLAGDARHPDDVTVHVLPTPPTTAYVLATVGAAVGLVAGWLVAAAVLARARHRATADLAALVLLVVAVLGTLPAAGLDLLAVGSAGSLLPEPPWSGYHFALARPLGACGALALGAVLLLTVRRRPRTRVTA